MKKVNEKDFDLVSGGRVPDAAGGGGGWGPAISGINNLGISNGLPRKRFH